ncbi:hypothetical protein HPB50_004836 [Hyalomma asiaticum]|uniref:Uncharacterized protein n=1 Tax=Hyalomma asiaticum TaxID=266040 RepID=A0ACB7SJE0_HYAAI|nr:hypothetical protein HPB50_004836 [Hyalomma asiaticum]
MRALLMSLVLASYYQIAATYAEAGAWPLAMILFKQGPDHIGRLYHSTDGRPLLDHLQTIPSSHIEKLCILFEQTIGKPSSSSSQALTHPPSPASSKLMPMSRPQSPRGVPDHIIIFTSLCSPLSTTYLALRFPVMLSRAPSYSLQKIASFSKLISSLRWCDTRLPFNRAAVGLMCLMEFQQQVALRRVRRVVRGDHGIPKRQQRQPLPLQGGFVGEYRDDNYRDVARVHDQRSFAQRRRGPRPFRTINFTRSASFAARHREKRRPVPQLFSIRDQPLDGGGDDCERHDSCQAMDLSEVFRRPHSPELIWAYDEQ